MALVQVSQRGRRTANSSVPVGRLGGRHITSSLDPARAETETQMSCNIAPSSGTPLFCSVPPFGHCQRKASPSFKNVALVHIESSLMKLLALDASPPTTLDFECLRSRGHSVLHIPLHICIPQTLSL